MFNWMKKRVPSSGPIVFARLTEEAVPPVQFSKAVSGGFVDNDGKWHESRADAERSSASAHMVTRMTAADISYRAYLSEPASKQSVLKEPDTLKAMAILGRDA